MATEYFAESIWSSTGFWGSKCAGYFQYILGWCSDESEQDDDDQDEEEEDESRPMFAIMGENCDTSYVSVSNDLSRPFFIFFFFVSRSRGTYYVITNKRSPYAKGLLPLRALLNESEIIFSQDKL